MGSRHKSRGRLIIAELRRKSRLPKRPGGEKTTLARLTGARTAPKQAHFGWAQTGPMVSCGELTRRVTLQVLGTECRRPAFARCDGKWKCHSIDILSNGQPAGVRRL